jgi:hypothetical protein
MALMNASQISRVHAKLVQLLKERASDFGGNFQDLDNAISDCDAFADANGTSMRNAIRAGIRPLFNARMTAELYQEVFRLRIQDGL